MVAHLHPRSRSTLSLFSSCLAISFLVVAAPHILPCPVDSTQFADSATDASGETRRRRRRKPSSSPDSLLEDQDSAQVMAPKRECPVPKPGGLIGQVMGFTPNEQRQPPTIIVQSLRERHQRGNTGDSSS